MGGGTLTDSAGITIGSGATLIGKGTVSGPVNGTGTITANGGTLEFTSAVGSTSASSFHIANVAGSVLKFDGAVGTTSIHPTITFDGGLGVLDLSSVTLSNFHAVVANFTSGEGIKVAGAADVVLDASGMFITVYDAAHNSLGIINLSASYTGNEFSVSGGTISVAGDTTTPTGVTPDLAAASDSGLSPTDDITNVGGLTFNVALNATVAVGDTVQLLLAGAPLAHPVTHTITFADRDAGSVNLTITGGDLGADGSKSISARFSDAAGHVSTTSALVITLDTTAPTASLALDAITADNILNAAEAGGTVAVTGTVGGDVQDGDTVTLTVNGTTYTGTVAGGSFSIDVAGSDLAADADHTVAGSVTTTDAAGNPATATTSQTYAVDTTVTASDHARRHHRGRRPQRRRGRRHRGGDRHGRRRRPGRRHRHPDRERHQLHRHGLRRQPSPSTSPAAIWWPTPTHRRRQRHHHRRGGQHRHGDATTRPTRSTPR